MDHSSIVKKLQTKELVALYNHLTPGAAPVRKFTDRTTAEARLVKLLGEKSTTLETILEMTELSEKSREDISAAAAKAPKAPKPPKTDKVEAEPKAAKPPKAPKEKRTPKAPLPGKQNRPTGGLKGKIVKILLTPNPCRKGSAREESYNRIAKFMKDHDRDFMTGKEVKDKVGRTGDIYAGVIDNVYAILPDPNYKPE